MQRVFLTIFCILALPGLMPAQKDEVDLELLLDRVGERVSKFYDDLLTVTWTDVARQQTKEFTYSSIIRHQPRHPADMVAPYYLRLVTEPESTDPPPADMSWLMFLHQGPRAVYGARPATGYGFSFAGRVRLEGRDTLMVDVTFRGRPAASTARIWIDAITYDILRLEMREKPLETTVRFQPVPFDNPDQTLLLPVSAEITRRINPRDTKSRVVRTTHSFTNFKRFTGDVKIGGERN
jgi:hypothetical protein